VDSVAGNATDRSAVAGVLFISSGMTAVTLMSTFNQSPDEPSDPHYMLHAVGISMFFAAASSYISRSVWPVIGAGVINGYLYWLYAQNTEE
jgi:hypothetical protein